MKPVSRKELLEQMHTPISRDGAGLAISFELFPPKTEKAEANMYAAVAELAQLAPDFFSVTYGAGGSTREGTKQIVTKIQESYGVPTAAHLTCVAATRQDIDAIARQYWDAGISRIVALRGDPPGGAGEKYAPTPGGYEYADGLVKGLRAVADFDISVAGYPETHPEALSAQDDLAHVKRKCDAGAARILTQFFMNPAHFLRYARDLKALGVTTPLVAGILPISNFARMVEFAGKCGTEVPAWLAEVFDGLDDDAGLRHQVATAFVIWQCRTLYEAGVRDFHFYTLNRADLTAAACRALGLKPGGKKTAVMTG